MTRTKIVQVAAVNNNRVSMVLSSDGEVYELLNSQWARVNYPSLPEAQRVFRCSAIWPGDLVRDDINGSNLTYSDYSTYNEAKAACKDLIANGLNNEGLVFPIHAFVHEIKED